MNQYNRKHEILKTEFYDLNSRHSGFDIAVTSWAQIPFKVADEIPTKAKQLPMCGRS